MEKIGNSIVANNGRLINIILGCGSSERLFFFTEDNHSKVSEQALGPDRTAKEGFDFITINIYILKSNISHIVCKVVQDTEESIRDVHTHTHLAQSTERNKSTHRKH